MNLSKLRHTILSFVFGFAFANMYMYVSFTISYPSDHTSPSVRSFNKYDLASESDRESTIPEVNNYLEDESNTSTSIAAAPTDKTVVPDRLPLPPPSK